MRESPDLVVVTAANQNEASPGAETRCFAEASAVAPLTGPESTALALLRCGRSFAEAADSSGVDADRMLTLWFGPLGAEPLWVRVASKAVTTQS